MLQHLDLWFIFSFSILSKISTLTRLGRLLSRLGIRFGYGGRLVVLRFA